MYFCPNCSYIFDISKSSNSKEVVDNRIIIKKTNDLFKLIEDKTDLTKYKAEFTKEEINKNKKYQKIKDEDKYFINVIFENVVSSGAEFKCHNCNFTKQITETKLLYNINYNKFINNNKINTIEENQLITNNQLLPLTHDYNCKNVNCATHKDISLKKAVFYKNINSFNVIYICCVCYYNW